MSRAFSFRKSSEYTLSIHCHGCRIVLAAVMQGVRVTSTSLDNDAEQLRDDFQMFIAHLADAISKRSEQEELSIMNAR